jgi:hypothetical protein
MSDTSDDEIDPSIAALLQETEDSLPDNSRAAPKFEVVNAEEAKTQVKKQFAAQKETKIDNKKLGEAVTDKVPEVDLSVKAFRPIEKYFEDTPGKMFDDPGYYKNCLTGEGQASQRLHQLLVKYLNCTDKKDRTVYRQQIVTAYWEFLRSLAPKMINPRIADCKKMAMRYGVVLPSLFSPEQKDFFSRAIVKNVTGEPVLYVDEWMREVAAGRLTLSATDEVPQKSKGPGAEAQRIQQLKSKNSGKLQSIESLVTVKESERVNVEIEVRDRVEQLCEHQPIYGLEGHTMAYTDIQKRLFAEITTRFRQLQKIDRELSQYLKEFEEAKGIASTLESKESELQIDDQPQVGKEELMQEMTTVRQMAKMTCGRQGNQFPIFTREFFHCMDKGTGFRENVIRELAWIESVDPQCFCRIHKNVPHRIVPYTLLIPSYGDLGFCWEPFDRFNRITSRGRIVIPMYPRDLRTACLMAVGDLRWQVAKEKASFDWMTDGLTGHYYQYFDEHKMKGDVKAYFIEDYILWMTKESQGTQKLDKEVRAIFWRYLPFPQETKEKLKKMSLIYQELFQRDVNRSMSDGY